MIYSFFCRLGQEWSVLHDACSLSAQDSHSNKAVWLGMVCVSLLLQGVGQRWQLARNLGSTFINDDGNQHCKKCQTVPNRYIYVILFKELAIFSRKLNFHFTPKGIYYLLNWNGKALFRAGLRCQIWNYLNCPHMSSYKR